MRSPSAARAVLPYIRDANDPRRSQRAWADLSEGMGSWRLAMALARLDLRNRYRGSVLGPFWVTISTAVMIVGIGLLYSTLFKLSLREYLPFLSVSLIIWGLISQTVTDACTSFIGSEGMIRQVPLPYTVHVLRFVIRNAIIAAHSLPLILVVFVVCSTSPGPGAWLAAVGLVLLAVNAFAVGLVLGIVCARFRDVPQIVASVLQFAFFLSPVLWRPELLGPLQIWLPLNPFYSLMETVRGPLVTGGAGLAVWAAALAYTGVFCAIAWAFFVRFRARIAFWI